MIPLAVKETHPRKDFTSITQLGLKALHLGQAHAGALEERLPEGLCAGLAEDLQKLGEVIPAALKARAQAEAATAEQQSAVEAGATLVRQFRAAVRRAKAPVDVRHGYGIGRYMNPRIVRDVKAALQQILARGKGNPAEAKSLGIVKRDLDGIEAALAAITEADRAQEKKRASAPESTRERNRVANRILAAVARIEGAGRLEFAGNEGMRAQFEALGGGQRGRRRRASSEKRGDVDAVVAKADDVEPTVAVRVGKQARVTVHAPLPGSAAVLRSEQGGEVGGGIGAGCP
ncbi:hypothetical protein GF068_07940 [Polyangium spumosum]|uniref:Uncharacterized protein n=1 Tax=Polyangium spumosum TaxID=889282 RepID=A0A6N7PNX8_9BACT|nr:hypothetical protein [Polyangium spumosum]MRG91855.1 hypothetical protein [Polyangium spumosum]